MTDLRRDIRSGMATYLLQRGFRAARQSEDDWVRPVCEGVHAIVGIPWVMRFAPHVVIAKLRFGFHLVEGERLWASAGKEAGLRARYYEEVSSLGVPAEVLMGQRRPQEWKITVEELPKPLLEHAKPFSPEQALKDMLKVVERYGLPFLESMHSNSAVLEEVLRRHPEGKATQFVTECHLACLQHCGGGTSAAIDRVNAALALLPPGGGSITASRRKAAELLLERLGAGVPRGG